MATLKTFARDWLPPAMTRIIRQIRGGGIGFEGPYATWEEASVHSTGYDAEDILAKVLAATLKVKRGEAVFERDSVLFDQIEYAWPVLAGLMWAAARNRGMLNVLDFGGALGSSYFQNRRFLQSVPDVRWNVVEQEHYVDAGRTYIQDEDLRFYTSIEECLFENKPNVVFLSGVLQYLPNTSELINNICALKCGVIIIDRTIVNSTGNDRIYVQQVPETIYSASYPCRSLSEKRLIESFGMNYILESSFPSLSFPALSKIDSEFKGYIILKET